ncbi:hypothetical protein [Caulobacter sp. RHG1]|uniref:hypothetical protein n=1 Tax=Caulobacter sp. (strain RHG1) TaxID=2545762 RepID=UPI001551AEFA|nr:hypothetical protein [Caulobacter sp. RHG1]
MTKISLDPAGFRSLDDGLGWRGGPAPSGDIWQIAYGARTGWKLIAEYVGDGGPAWVIFEDHISHRAHDERELVVYWTQRNEEGAPVSFAYEIMQSAYLAEMHRGVSGLAVGGLRHFLFGGQNLCLEVIATTPPMITYTAPQLPADVETSI